jgi:uncharacterized membrane protein YczE
LEATVLLFGFVLGGTVGVGTVIFAVAIGPLIQFFLPRVAAPLELRATDPERNGRCQRERARTF